MQQILQNVSNAVVKINHIVYYMKNKLLTIPDLQPFYFDNVTKTDGITHLSKL